MKHQHLTSQQINLKANQKNNIENKIRLKPFKIFLGIMLIGLFFDVAVCYFAKDLKIFETESSEREE